MSKAFRKQRLANSWLGGGRIILCRADIFGVILPVRYPIPRPVSALHRSRVRVSNVDSQPRSCGHPSQQSPKALTPLSTRSSLRYRSARLTQPRPQSNLVLSAFPHPTNPPSYMPFPSWTVPFPGVLLDFALYHCDRSATRREVSNEPWSFVKLRMFSTVTMSDPSRQSIWFYWNLTPGTILRAGQIFILETRIHSWFGYRAFTLAPKGINPISYMNARGVSENLIFYIWFISPRSTIKSEGLFRCSMTPEEIPDVDG